MGRRKIEIQPITHERNRSVTFLKRKNGLFKKAYELGVLCSVDVAVIIFEGRPGHHVKLYQYGSTDVQDVIQRHLRFEGERDTRGPADFSSTAPGKANDADDDDDDDDQSQIPQVRTAGAIGKRSSDGTIKPEYGPGDKLATPVVGEMPMSDLVFPIDRSTSVPVPLSSIPMHSQVTTGGDTSSLPISGERHSNLRMSQGNIMNKKARLSGVETPTLRKLSAQPADSQNPNTGMTYPYPPSTGPSTYRPSEQPASYQSFLPGQQSFNFPYSGTSRVPQQQQQPRTTDYSSRTSYNQRAGMYNPQLGRSPAQHLQPSGSNPELLTGFIDTDDGRQSQGQGFGGIGWPSHNPPQAQSQDNGHPSGTPAQGPGWLDFLTNSSGLQAGPGGSLGVHPPASTRSGDSLSWERDRADSHAYALDHERRTPSSAASPAGGGKSEDSNMKQDARGTDRGEQRREKDKG